MDITVDYMPTEKQRLFHTSTAYEVLYGGAAGGGKSKAIVMEAFVDALTHAGVHAYLFRRSYPELKETLIKEALASIPKQLYTYSAAEHDLRLINGSVLHFRFCATLADAYRYQGAEMHRLYIDELTHFSKEIYDYLCTRLRAPKSMGITPYVRCTSNPGGVGHGWVKQKFIEGRQPLKIYEKKLFSPVLNRTQLRTAQYIPATATDNPYLGDGYVFELENKPAALRKALLYGDWDVFEGQVFGEFTDDSAHYIDRLYTHVIEPFDIPKTWKRYRSFDWGYSKPFSVAWWAEDADGVLYRYREYYGAEAPNVGIKIEPAELAKNIAELEKREPAGSITGIADPSIFDESRGSDGSIARIMQRHGVYFERGDNARIAGKMQLHYRLSFGADGRPRMYVFKNCLAFIRTTKSLCYSNTASEDVDTAAEDHAYDEARYMCMYRPVKPLAPKRGRFVQDDPLNMFEKPQARGLFDGVII